MQAGECAIIGTKGTGKNGCCRRGKAAALCGIKAKA